MGMRTFEYSKVVINAHAAAGKMLLVAGRQSQYFTPDVHVVDRLMPDV